MVFMRNSHLFAACCWLVCGCSPDETGTDGGAARSDAGEETPELDAAEEDAERASDDAGEESARDAGPSVTTDAGRTADAGRTTDAAAMLGDSGALDSGALDSGVRDPGTSGDGKITIKTYAVQPELTDKGAPRGRSFRFNMDSTKSVIFDGKDASLNPSKPRLLTRQIMSTCPRAIATGRLRRCS
jgi:hypothetical protein